MHSEVARLVARHLDPRTHRAWIIGSEASGRALPGSDVDVALEDLPTLRAFDVVDLGRARDRFRQTAMETAIPLVLENGPQ